LYDPINFGEIETTGGHVRGEERGELILHEREIDCHPFVLFLSPVEFENWGANAKLTERLVHEPDLLAAREENEDFIPQMRFDEGEQHVKFLVGFYHHVMLFEV
jgi:hypothetical protein